MNQNNQINEKNVPLQIRKIVPFICNIRDKKQKII